MLIDHLLQIKNFTSTAHALATRDGIRVNMSHLEVAIAQARTLTTTLEERVKSCSPMCSSASIPRLTRTVPGFGLTCKKLPLLSGPELVVVLAGFAISRCHPGK